MASTSTNPANPFAIVVADVKAFIAKVQAGLKWFGAECAAAVNWVDKSIPGAQQALATLFQVADASATALETQAATGLQDVVAGAIDSAGTHVANLLSGAGLDLTSKAALSAADVATVTAVSTIAHNSIDVALAKILGETAAVATAANAANTATPATSAPAAAPQPAPAAQ